MSFSFTFGFLVTSPGHGAVGADSLEATLGQLMEAMLAKEGESVFDTAVGATLEQGIVEVDISVRATSEQEAAALARDFVGAAIADVGDSVVGPFAFAGRQSGRGMRTWHERRVELSGA